MRTVSHITYDNPQGSSPMTEDTPVVIFNSEKATFRDAFSDLKGGLVRSRLWTQFAVRDVRGRFSGAVLGSLWFIIMHSLIVLGLAVMYSKILGADIRVYLPYVAVGLTVWNIISGVITDGSGVFQGNAIYLKQVKLPYSFFLYRLNLKHLILFVYQSTVVVVMYGFLKMWPEPLMLLAIPAFLLVLVFLFAASLLAGILAARFRDFNGLIQSALRFAFFMTPIFWDARRLGDYAWLMNYNPFYHFLEIVRAPLLGEIPSTLNYSAAIIMTILTILASILAFRFSVKKISYWI
jgi:ABC-2 type transport system permease protein/lipopolysaccharide transport system permease protein